MIDFRAAFSARGFSSTHFPFWPFLVALSSLMLCFVYNIFLTEISGAGLRSKPSAES